MTPRICKLVYSTSHHDYILLLLFASFPVSSIPKNGGRAGGGGGRGGEEGGKKKAKPRQTIRTGSQDAQKHRETKRSAQNEKGTEETRKCVEKALTKKVEDQPGSSAKKDSHAHPNNKHHDGDDDLCWGSPLDFRQHLFQPPTFIKLDSNVIIGARRC
eukprot:747078-Hanusia_phi.AAC.2